MTERGLPIVDGAPACPFVAFEDDRDERGIAEHGANEGDEVVQLGHAPILARATRV